MPLIVAKWPDSSLSIIRAPRAWTDLWLFDCLDREGDPMIAEIYVLTGREVHMGFINRKCQDAADSHMYAGKKKRIEFTQDILRRRYPLFGGQVQESQEKANATEAL